MISPFVLLLTRRTNMHRLGMTRQRIHCLIFKEHGTYSKRGLRSSGW